jgi:hypothetical protein
MISGVSFWDFGLRVKGLGKELSAKRSGLSVER